MKGGRSGREEKNGKEDLIRLNECVHRIEIEGKEMCVSACVRCEGDEKSEI